jgi:glucosamine--fructose-6-phosphate aminotransferase (isomerizing)
MCGITARVGTDDGVEELLTGLENLEYRGYDSAGIAVENGSGLSVVKRRGDIAQLKDHLREATPTGPVGVGHTRWSTHGAPTDENAHPHTDCGDRVAVVHNGIIENHGALRAELRERGHTFTSDTDTEVLPHLIEERLDAGDEPSTAFHAAVSRLEGSFAVAALVTGTDTVYATREGSPLVLGVKDGTYFLASDIPAFLEFTDTVLYLEDGDVVELTPAGYRVTDRSGGPVDRPLETVDWSPDEVERGEYDHYMLKEIHEQPTAVARATGGRIAPATGEVTLEDFPPGAFADVADVQFVGCGTSYHAALYACHLLARRGIRAQAFQASEYASGPVLVEEDTLVVGVTQSGETADTLAALRRAAGAGARTLALTNVVGSTAARECEDALFIRAGPEIGVAATKTFSSQVTTLLLLAERLADDLGTGEPDRRALLDALAALPDDVERVLEESRAGAVARRYVDSAACFFIGRGVVNPVAREGALKFKEITYTHAEGFASGELKHGPLALVTPDTPVVAAFSGRGDGKTTNNVQEAQARGAPIVVVGEADAVDPEAVEAADEVLTVPRTHPDVAGVLVNVQLQLLAYRVADLLDRSIDKPRNLAKSVTVE